MKPVILLTCSGRRVDLAAPAVNSESCECKADIDGAGRWCLKSSYICAVEAAGGAPVLLPNSADQSNVRAAVAAAGGLLLTGGWDIDPSCYGRAAHASVKVTDPTRDATELAAIAEAMRLRKPILGICRGIQILNVALGGTLIQDIPSCNAGILPASCDAGFQPASCNANFQPASDKTTRRRLEACTTINHAGRDHSISTQRGSVIASLWGESIIVNSRHHQAVERIADGLAATAWSDDGIVEAVQSADAYPLLAVQSHPEDIWPLRRELLAPFEWLVKNA